MGKCSDDPNRINIENLGSWKEVWDGIENCRFQKDLILELSKQISEKKSYKYLDEWKEDEYFWNTIWTAFNLLPGFIRS